MKKIIGYLMVSILFIGLFSIVAYKEGVINTLIYLGKGLLIGLPIIIFVAIGFHLIGKK